MSRKPIYDVAMRKPLSSGQVLSANLQRLMDEAKPPITQMAVSKVSGIPQRTISRIKRGEVSPTLNSIDGLAKAFGLLPWQLLVPEMDPRNPPLLRAASQEEKELYDRLLAAAEQLAKYKT
jgi:transcriptional regulator with XRE-family HTH domain